MYLNPASADDDKAAAAKLGAQGPYEIVRSTADRVWRLNRNTGEISVCTLEGVNLICTNSTEATERREAKKAKDLELIDKFLEAIKSLVRTASEQETTN